MNITGNWSVSKEECLLPKAAIVSGLASILIIMVISIFGNLLVIIILCIGKRRSPDSSHLLVISVAVSDLMTALTVLPFDVVYWIHFPTWPLGPAICRLWNAFFFAFLSGSAIGITEICIDIFLAVTRPLHYNVIMTKKRCKIIIIVSWIWCSTVGLLIYFFQEEPPQNVYLFDLNSYAYGSYLFIQLIIPFLIVPVMYLKVFNISLHHASQIQFQKYPKSWKNTELKTWGNTGILTFSQKLKLAKTFGFVTVGFCFCWAPFLVVQLFYVFELEDKVDGCGLEIADTVVCWFSYVQCCINPILYCIRHKSFRDMVCRVLKRTNPEVNRTLIAANAYVTTSL